MPNFSSFGQLDWSGPWWWLKPTLHLIIGGNLYVFDFRLERKRQQILKEMAKLENLDSGDGGGDSDTGSKEGGKESGK